MKAGSIIIAKIEEIQYFKYKNIINVERKVK